jgi:hypothetical protein
MRICGVIRYAIQDCRRIPLTSSSQFSVASYIIPRIELSHMATACNIYSIELQLVQTYSIIPHDVYQIGGYDPEEYRYPSDSFPLMTYGEKPKTNRPGLDAKALWRGTDQPEEEDAKRFEWEAAEPVRLPVAQEIRPSTFQGYAQTALGNEIG